MFITELFEPSRKIIAILPGRFQPWHRGHRASYDFLAGKFGAENTYIATSDKVDPPRSPFNFNDKLKFIGATGVDTSAVIKTANPYRAEELVKNFDPASTILVFGISAKDMAEDPRFKFGTLKNGSPSYFQPFPKDASQCEPLSKHGYIITVPTIEFNVAGKPMTSATEFRRNFASAPEEVQKEMINDLFGSYSPMIHRILKTKLASNAINI